MFDVAHALLACMGLIVASAIVLWRFKLARSWQRVEGSLLTLRDVSAEIAKPDFVVSTALGFRIADGHRPPHRG